MTYDPESNLEKGFEYERINEYELAVYHLTLALEEQLSLEDEIQARERRSLCNGQAGHYQQALLDADWLIENGQVHKYGWRAWMREKTEDYTGALEDYTKVIELAPRDNFESYLKRGQMYFFTQQFKEAIEDFTAALSLENRSTIGQAIYMWRGKAYIDDGQYQAGLDDFQCVSDIVGFEPHDVFWFCFHRGLAKEALGDASGAMKDFRQATIPENHPQAERIKQLLKN